MTDLAYFEAFAKSKRSEQAFAEPALSDSELQQLEAIRSQVPHLEALQNNSELQSQYHGRLVQVRALVVETLDPEIYPGVVQEQDGLWSCGKYGYDVPSLENGTAKNLSYWERQPVAVKPIPGLSTWCNTYMTSGTSVDRISDTLASTQLGEPMHQSLTDTAFPHQSSDSVIVLLHNEAAKNARLHDVIDVIGILDPLLHDDGAGMEVQDEFDELMEEEEVLDEAVDAENMGGNENSAVPTPRRPKAIQAQLRVHAMHVQRFSNLDSSPYDLMLVKRTLASDFMDSMRVAAIQWLAAPFGGDELLGELLLLQLLCKSPKVTNGAVTRRMTLNICGLPKATTSKGNVDSSKLSSAAASQPFGRTAVDMASPGPGLPAGTTSTVALQVAEAVSAIYPFVQILPATDQTTGCQQLMPNHNSASNRLHPGLMQQAPHFCLVVDECISALSPTSQEHDAWRCRNMRAMHEYVQDGVLTANYMWQQVRLPVSGSVLVVSDEPSSFSESCRLCVSAAGTPERTTASVDSSVHPVQGIRCYLACAWDLWDGLEYERQDGGRTGSHPRWVSETLVAEGKRVAAAVNSSGTCDTTRAYETSVMLLHCLCISQGRNQINRERDWGAVERLVASCQARSPSGTAGNAGPKLKKQEHATPVPQTRHVQPSTDQEMDLDSDQVLRERQPQQEVSAGQAMIAALRSTGAL